MLERVTVIWRRCNGPAASKRGPSSSNSMTEVQNRFSSTFQGNQAPPGKIDFRSRMLEASASITEASESSTHKPANGKAHKNAHRAPLASEIPELIFSDYNIPIRPTVNANTVNIDKISIVEVTNHRTHAWGRQLQGQQAPDTKQATAAAAPDRRQKMIQAAAKYSLSKKRNNPRSFRELNFSSNIEELISQYKQAKHPGPGLLGNLVEALSRSGRFSAARRFLEQMEKAGFKTSPVYARAKALNLLFQAHVQPAIDFLFLWVDSFLQSADKSSFQYERDLKQLYSAYVAVFEQLFRRGYPYMAHSVAKHAEEKQIDISGATLSFMVPHLLKRMDLDSIIKESITRHMQKEGFVPPETLRVLISACIKQRQLELAFSLVDTFIDAKHQRDQRLDSSECRDLLFIFVSLGKTDLAENLMTELYRRGNLDERVVSTIVHALSIRGIKSELRNLTQRDWWARASTSAAVYSRFFLACCCAEDFELAISEFERLAGVMDYGVTEMFESLINAFTKFYRTSEVSAMFALLQRSNVDIPSDIYAAILKMYCATSNTTGAAQIAAVVAEKKPKFTSKLFSAMMSYQELCSEPKEVMKLLDQARAERVALTPEILARGLKACLELEAMNAALGIFHEASQHRILTDPVFLRTWFYVCGRLKATGILHSTWNIIKSTPNASIDESVWIQVVAAFCSADNPRGALAVLSESLMDSVTGVRLSVLYPQAILTKTMILYKLNFLPPPARAAIVENWKVAIQADEYGIFDSFYDKYTSAPRLSETDRQSFAALVNDWIHTYDRTDNAYMSARSYYIEKKRSLGVNNPEDDSVAPEETQEVEYDQESTNNDVNDSSHHSTQAGDAVSTQTKKKEVSSL